MRSFVKVFCSLQRLNGILGLLGVDLLILWLGNFAIMTSFPCTIFDDVNILFPILVMKFITIILIIIKFINIFITHIIENIFATQVSQCCSMLQPVKKFVVLDFRFFIVCKYSGAKCGALEGVF